ncbi:MAG: hypothetical protein P4L50_04510 [Anaerolineaceae bacterium]|nr:hypothetical protein [Anaerolineaceae bacterium]
MSQPSKYKLFIAFLLFGIETCAASAVTFMTNTDPKNAFLLGRSVERWLLTLLLAAMTAAFVGTAVIVYKNEGVRTRITTFFSKRIFQVGVVLVLLVISLSLIAGNYSQTFMVRLMPAGVSLWLIGLELIFLSSNANPPQPIQTGPKRAWIAAVCCILAIYLAALLPSHIPALMNGAPWNTHFEFILLALLLPLAALVNWRSFSKRWMMIPAVLALAIKLFLDLAAPSVGISLQAYDDQLQMAQGKWMRGYESVLDGTASAVMQQPYDSYGQFPLEWANEQGFDTKSTWLGLKLSGYARLDPGERLIFVANGVDQGEIDFIDTATGQKYRTLVVNGDRSIDPGLYQSAPDTRSFQLQGTLVYKGDKTYRLRPLIISANGSISDPFAQAKIWRSRSGLNLSQSQFNFYRFLGLAADALLILVILAGLVWGMWSLFDRNLIGSLDLYLAASAVPVYLFFNLKPNTNMNVYIELFILSAVFIKALETIIIKRERTTGQDFLVAIMPIFLVSLLSLNIQSLRQITIFPQGQDGLEYQSLARDIFVNADYLIINSPPHAYKVLFPYLVGILHVLFGQSSAGLFFLYAWCAGLTAFYASEILSSLKLPRGYGYGCAFVLLFILMGPLFSTYYFSYGLIEPVASSLLVVVLYFALKRNLWGTFISSIFLVLFRLDYLGAAFAGIFLMSEALQGSIILVWKSIIQFILKRWKTLLAYGASLIALPVLLTVFYYLIYPGYQLSTSDTRYTSLAEMLHGLLKILNGGSPAEVHMWLGQVPLDVNVLLAVLYLGTGIGILSLILRFKPLDRIDARFGIVLAGFYLVYAAASPTGYSPRFSTPLVPLGLMIILAAVHHVFSGNQKACQTD